MGKTPITAVGAILFSFNYFGNAQECASSLHEGYTLTSTSEIGPSMEGEQVVITSKVSPSDFAACTQAFCDDSDPCCNLCNGNLMAGGINLYPGELEIGCAGTNCDWNQQCTYNEGDVVVAFGVVSGNGTSINVNHKCLLGTSDGLEENCGMPREGYTETSLSALSADMNGTNVMVTASIEVSELASCTMMLCFDENLCCNSCSSLPSFGDGYVSLRSDTSDNAIGCHGTNCDYQDNCIYNDGDVVTVYGKVVVESNTITLQVEDHCSAQPTCKDYGSSDFGPCFMHMGYGVVNGTCTGIGGCGSVEDVFFDDLRDCKAACPSARCDDYLGVSFGNCKMVVGYGIVDGVCNAIGGCDKSEDLFVSMAACKAACGGGHTATMVDSIVTTTIADPESIVSVINLANSSCTDFTGKFFGNCKMIVGYGLVDGVCTTLGGCNTTEGMFDTMEKCEVACEKEDERAKVEEAAENIATIFDLADVSCVDFTGDFFGNCKMIVGYGLVDGSCSTLGGCNRTEHMFETMEKCELACGEGGVRVKSSGSATIVRYTLHLVSLLLLSFAVV